jgi:hypothetical protein
MTILEKRSAIRIKALKTLVEKGEYSAEYAIVKLDELNSKGLITATDYEETFDYFADLMEKETISNDDDIVEENISEIEISENN